MHQTVLACKAHNIAIGAHPGLPDIQGFGRREIKMSPEELTAAVRYQVGALKAFLDAEDVPLHHVKPHGVLYGIETETCVEQFMLVYPRERLCSVLRGRCMRKLRKSLVCLLSRNCMATSSTTRTRRWSLTGRRSMLRPYILV
jgi:hypothetical protein